ncbi:MAG: glutamate-1-semialdehyde-2,1-aminomutase [Candidatus Dadabacteria bacterium]|nr:MAG: glutamate-1-semialdehyde-2,1-aminomutase [Candidatus Dadabacteria bacterium]
MALDSRSKKLFQRAQRVIPGGVNSPVRAWAAVGGSPRFVASARGSTVTDADGNQYIDYVGSWGPMILGHAHPRILAALAETMSAGTSFGACTELEVELAERLVEVVPSLERVRLVNSGTEATMSAIRVARGYTGRPAVIKFAGCYHGHSDGLLVRAGSGATTLGVPDSPGVPEDIVRWTRVARYNDLDSVERLCDDQCAAVIVEPVAGNMGVVPPNPGFLEGLRELTRQRGALLIFDEVISGLRVGLGGYQAVCGVVPDLTCLGKIIGGGLPVGAYGGRADVMDQVAPAGPVYQAGTLSGNPLAVRAGLTTLELLATEPPYERLDLLGERLENGLRQALGNRRGCVQRVGSMLTVFFGVDRVENYDDALRADTRRFAAFFRALLEEGIWIPPSQFEAWFLSAAHTEEDVDKTVAAAERAMSAVDSV